MKLRGTLSDWPFDTFRGAFKLAILSNLEFLSAEHATMLSGVS